jgi:hypothetical protein
MEGNHAAVEAEGRAVPEARKRGKYMCTDYDGETNIREAVVIKGAVVSMDQFTALSEERDSAVRLFREIGRRADQLRAQRDKERAWKWAWAVCFWGFAIAMSLRWVIQ